MFTGIIEDLGIISKVSPGTLAIETMLGDIKMGDSISINGICLTVTSIAGRAKSETTVSFDCSPETLKRTSLAELGPGDRVNIERAMVSGGRFGGHFLSGHVEGIEKLLKVQVNDNSQIFTFSISEHLRKYVVSKGSVAIDGISLTVADCNISSFSVAVIPHTLKNTTLGFKKAGDKVNFEPDLLAKYLENTVKFRNQGLTKEFLKEKGYL